MEKKSRLGRGLSSLLNSANDLPVEREIQAESALAEGVSGDAALPPGVEMLHVELSRVVANPAQPRRRFDEASLASLAESIKVAGIIQPIVVRAVSGGYEVIAGERRWRAAKLAGLVTIPVIVRPVDPLQQSQLALIENIHREDLNPIDRAVAYRDIIRQMGLTQAELATQLGEERASVGHYIRLLELPDKTREMLAAGVLSMGHAKILSGLEDPNQIDRLAQTVVSQQLSVRRLEQLIKEGDAPKPPTKLKSSTPHLVDLERQLSRDLQMRAEVKQAKKGGKGRLILHYASLDQFDELIHRLGVKIED